jgi:lipid-A-disaccharide synthase
MIDASKEIAKELGAVQFLIAKFKDLPMDLYESRMKGLNFDIRIVDGHAHDALASSDFAIVASGTATLESAIIGTPLIIVYKASLLTYLVAKFIANIRFLGIVNIIAKKEVAPEFIQYRAIPKAIAAKAIEILKDAKRAACMKKGLDAVRSSLGSPGASQRAAKAVLYLINT